MQLLNSGAPLVAPAGGLFKRVRSAKHHSAESTLCRNRGRQGKGFRAEDPALTLRRRSRAPIQNVKVKAV